MYDQDSKPFQLQLSPGVIENSVILNVFFSETAWPFFFKLHVEPCVKWGWKIYENGHGPLNKMAAMPILIKTLKNLLLQNKESFEA